MKKIIVLLLMFLLTGCNGNNKLTVCNYKNNQELMGYKISSKYKIYSNDKIVKKVEIKQVIKSKSKDVLKNFEKSIDEQYSINNVKYGGYRYTSKLNNNKLTSKIIINYDVLDMDKFTTNNVSMKEFVNENNKLSLKGAKKLYESIGAICK